mgnify:CR=1 FL=1
MLLWTEGFEQFNNTTDFNAYLSSFWPLQFGGSQNYYDYQSGRLGGYSFRPQTSYNGGVSYWHLYLNSALHFTNYSNEGVLGFAYYYAENFCYYNDYRFIQVQSNTNSGAQFVIHFNSNNYLELRDGGNSTILVTSTFAIPLYMWCYFEFKFKIHNTEGYVEVYYDGQLILSKYNFNTNYQSTLLYPGTIYIFVPKRNALYDDMYYLDTVGPAPFNDRLGPIAIKRVMPTIDGTKVEWTVRSGGTSHYLELDDNYTIDTDSSYVQTSVTGAIDWFKFTAETGIVPIAVQVSAFTKLSMPGISSLAVGITNYEETANQFKSSSYLRTGAWDAVKALFVTSPDTTAWSLAKLNNTQFGIKQITGLS